MPQTYMRTSSATRGVNSSFAPVKELWILSMRFEPPTDEFRRHQFQERREFRTMHLARQCRAQGHEQVCALAAGALLEYRGETFEVAIRLLIGGSGRREKRPPRRRDNPLLLGPKRRKIPP